MPYGLIVDTSVVILGAFIGVVLGKRIPEKMKETLTIVFGLICFTLGITLIVGVNSLVPVGLALILGTALGELLDLDGKLLVGTRKLQIAITSKRGANSDSNENVVKGVLTLLPLFCFSTTMILGGINEAIGDHSMLLVKSVLDFFTAIIFAANYGVLVGLLSVPLFLVGILFYGLSSLLMPIMSTTMIADMNATGGVHCVACALCVIGVKQIRVNNIIPALFLALPCSWLWTLITC